MTRLTADLFPRRGRHPNRKTSEYSAFWIRIGDPGLTPRTTLREFMVVLWQPLRHCADRGILPPGR